MWSMSENPHAVKILFFAHLRELAGTRQLEMTIPQGMTVRALKQELIKKYPALERAMDHLITAVNQSFAQDEMMIPDHAEVAFFPPVSGGSGKITICRITEAEIRVDETQREITTDETGGICSFTGVVRGASPQAKIRTTEKLEYEAYGPMAESKMQEIAAEIRERWPQVIGVAIIQKVGEARPGTPVVIVSCSAAHRDEGIFEAARFGIDRLKEIVPVWKKEVGPDGEEWVEGSYFPKEAR